VAEYTIPKAARVSMLLKAAFKFVWVLLNKQRKIIQFELLQFFKRASVPLIDIFAGHGGLGEGFSWASCHQGEQYLVGSDAAVYIGGKCRK